ncbi:hypothetical protein BIV03_04080 [Curtobacterium sp. MCBA15_016]|uniref:hypothetical protein n=1 Tax=Curtobacterium sp. MCBA15_016 TaxID=1898740 RepID=UPI0008DCE970|nr:hypothetical protein [Curtobacterium sp. MCBA15_016]OII18171.1 hypothetical protein BIV03_04080 [Curtobacterium sp. MCBA15_016]
MPLDAEGRVDDLLCAFGALVARHGSSAAATAQETWPVDLRHALSAQVGFTDGYSYNVTVGCGSRNIAAGQTLYGLAVGDYWTYKIQTTTQDRFHYHPPTSVKKSTTLWAFKPHTAAISCAVYKGFPFGSGS